VWTENSQVLTDIFPITTTPLPDDPTYTQTFQNTIQDSLVNYLSYHIAYANSYGIPFWFIPQAHSWGGGLREPTTMEQEQMVNLALAYGAKGIHYFLYWTYAPNGTVVGLGLVDVNGNPRHIIYGGTSYAGDKWATVKAINQNLAIIGPTLMNLRWQGAKSWHNGSTAGTWPNIITNITSGDAPGSRYVESGWFADASNNNYFMLVNRRTINTESRNITSTFSLPSGNYEISDVASGNAWVITNNGSFTDNFSPGQGKLYKIAPATYPTTRTLSAGQTMTVTPGAKLSFGTGASLVVNGTLNVNGTSSQRITFDRSGTSGTWGGIQINHGYYLYDRSTVQYCDIKNAATGITIYNAGPYIHHNTISGQGTYGVFSYSASPFFYNNTITGQAGGMYFGEYGSPWLVNNGTWPYGPGNNVIKSNGWGISASGSSPYLGSTIAGGYNSIYSNSTVDLWASGSGVYIWAQNNYWGGGNPNLVQLNGATINWVPALSTDPNGQGTYASQNVIAAAPSIATVSSNAVTPSIVNSTSSTTVLSAENEGLQQLLSLEINGKTDEAISGYVQLFKNDTSSNAKKYILGRLLECYSESGKKDFPAFLNQNIRTGLAATDELYAATEEVENIYLIRNGYVNQALENYKTLIKTFSNNEDIYKNALFNGWYLNYYQLKNTPQAAIYLGELKASFPNDNLTVITSLMTGITKSNSTTGEMKSNLLIGSDKQEGSFSAALPTVIELEANYPNPFNPSTVIRYQLPNTGHVSMTVFDMLGRQVATLVEGQKDAGYYSAVFDGSKYSSGIYFVRLIVQGSDSKPFLKTIKMLLAK
jgi:tetratricopeptide (TPR) repeat protein